MINHDLRRSAYKLLDVAAWTFGILTALIGASLKADAAKWEAKSHLLGEALAAIQASAWWSLLLLTVALAITQLARKLVGPPWAWATVKEVLDLFCQEVFKGRLGDPLHHHRATLFRHRRFRFARVKWPWSGWLVPIDRSGHTTRVCKSVFKAPDEADDAEGIAGQVWSRRAVLSVSGLPDLEHADDGTIAEYSRLTHIEVETARIRRPRARSFVGVPVDVRGKIWGVIVLDSRSPEPIDGVVHRLYPMVAKVLGKILERA